MRLMIEEIRERGCGPLLVSSSRAFRHSKAAACVWVAPTRVPALCPPRRAIPRDRLSFHTPMAARASRRPAHPPRFALALQMRRVVKTLGRVEASLDAKGVHALRVALRRCRSLAALMEEVDPHPRWREMKRRSRTVFRTLGALRDVQVLRRSVKTLTPRGDAARGALVGVLDQREVELRARARRAISHFDRRAWKDLGRTLDRRVRAVQLDGLAAECLALERYHEIGRLHQRAARTERSVPWHELRIAVKRFRHVVEGLLPDRQAAWEQDLRRVQDVLGEIHDLDVLAAFVSQEAAGIASDAVVGLHRAIGTARTQRVAQYLEGTKGPASVLQRWKAGMPHGVRVAAAASARLDATQRAMDPNPRRTACVARLALRLFDALARRQTGALDAVARVILDAAARLHGVRGARRETSRQKAARAIVRSLPVPPGWTSKNWEVLCQVIRYHRGAEPQSTHGRFARLPGARQALVRRLAGVLRVARALDRCGVASEARLLADATGAGVRLRLEGLTATREHVTRLAAAQHLLETHLRRRLLIEPLPGIPHRAGQFPRD